jgi:hypothetical protein
MHRLRALALVVSTAGVAVAQPSATPPSQPERLPRIGLFLEAFPIALGIARSEAGGETETGVAAGGSVGVGVFLDARTALKLRVDNVSYISEIEVNDTLTSQRLSFSAMGGADRYLSDTVWIGAAAGYTWLVDLVSDSNNSDNNDISSVGGPAVGARAGFDFYPLRRGSLRLALDGTAAFIDDSTLITVMVMGGFNVW